MTVRTQTALQTQIDTLLANNTSGDINGADVQSVCTDLNDTIADLRGAGSGSSAIKTKIDTNLADNVTGAVTATKYSEVATDLSSTIFTASWVYASIAIAEASSDPWIDGNTISITGGADFIYTSAMEVNGYSGLVHKDIFNDASIISTSATFTTGEGESTDPDVWDATITYGTGISADTLLDINSGYSRIHKVNNSAEPTLKANTLTSATDDIDVFIYDDMLMASTQASGGLLQFFTSITYMDSSNVWFIRVNYDTSNSATNLIVYNGTSTDLGIERTTRRRYFLYIRKSDGNTAIWTDGDSVPIWTGTAGSSLSSATRKWQIQQNQTSAGTADITLRSIILGRVVT